MMKIKKWLYITNYILLVICLLFSSFLANGERIFGEHPTYLLTLKEVIIVFAILAVLLGTLIFLNIKYGKYKPNWILVSLLGFLFLTNLIALLAFKDYETYTYEGIDGALCTFDFSITSSLRATFIIESAALLISTFLIFDVSYQIVNSKDLIKFISILSIAIIFVFMLISYITEFDKYINLIPSLFKDGVYIDAPRSLFVSKNNYALVLTISLIGFIFLHYFYKKWYFIAGAIFVYINIFFTTCKLLLILDFLFVAAYLYSKLIRKFNDNKKKSTIIAICSSSIIILAFISVVIVLATTNKFTSIFNQDGYNTFVTRSWIWRRSIEAINMSNWFTGVGHNLFGEILFRLNTFDVVSQFPNNTKFAHNGFIEWLGNGGISMLLIGLFLLFVLYYIAIKNIKKRDELPLISFFLLIIFTLYMVLESATIVLPKAFEAIVISTFIVAPTLAYHREVNITIS